MVGRFAFVCVVLLLLAGGGADHRCAGQVPPTNAEPIQIAEPADGAVVFADRVTVRGTASGSLRVILMLQEGEDVSRPWRVAQIAEVDPDGNFQTDVPLQRQDLDAGSRLIAVGTNASRALRFERPGLLLRSLPQIPRSEPLRLTVAGLSRPWGVQRGATERILFPVGGSPVGPSDSIVIEGSGQSRAVVLVSLDEAGAAWYVQNAAEPASPGKTLVRARFGNAGTTAGTKFRVRLAIPQNLDQSLLFVPGSELSKLPPDVRYGPDLIVRYDPDKEPTVDLEELQFEAAIAAGRHCLRIVSPVNGARVTRINDVVGFCQPGMGVVLLVRSEEDAKTWYVQSPCRVNGNRFQGNVYLGRQGTLAETKFEVIAVLVKPAEMDSWKAGESLEKIPPDVLLSERVRLIHNGSD